jgi:hypothetical protein
VLSLTLTFGKVKTVEESIVAEAAYRGCSLEDATQAIAQIAMEDRRRGVAIDRWYFEDTKWRANGKGDKGQRYENRLEEELAILDGILAGTSRV